jgi:sodium-dependent dicarboxylate transporter 2/3/5
LSGVATWNVLAVIVAVCLVVTFLTEITSNTATANILLPVLAGACLGSDGRWVVAPELLMVPAAVSASLAFMLPVGTPPNAIVFGTGEVSTRQMAREGLVLNLFGVVVTSLVCLFRLGG